MYIPSAFRVEDPEKLGAFMQAHSFATVVSFDGTAPYASHVPVLFEPQPGGHGTIISHLARANPQSHHLAAGGEVLVIFHGPHAYISPAWYETELAVPTWNYATVHAYGRPRIFTEPARVAKLLQDTVQQYEAPRAQPWSGDLPVEFRDKLMQAIVAFELPIERIEGKFKLGQNRPAADLQGVYDALSQSGDAASQAVAQMMVAECKLSGPPKA